MADIQNTSVYKSTLKDIKKMFAGEHVLVKADIFGTKYIDAHTKKEMPAYKALKILAGDY